MCTGYFFNDTISPELHDEYDIVYPINNFVNIIKKLEDEKINDFGMIKIRQKNVFIVEHIMLSIQK
jgi:hypothetical protein